MAEFERIHAGLMSPRDQQDFVFVAIEKVLGMLANQGIAPDNLRAGLLAYVKRKAENNGTKMAN